MTRYSGRFLRDSAGINALLKYANLIASIVGSILLVPIYLRHLGVEHYGAWLAVGAFAAWFAVFDPGIANLLIQKVSQSLGRADREALAASIRAGVVCTIAVAATVACLGLWLAGPIVESLRLTDMNREMLIDAFRLSVLGTALMILFYSLNGIIQGFHSSIIAGALVLTCTVGRMVSSVLLLQHGLGLLALPLGMLLSATCVLLASCFIVVYLARDYPVLARKTRGSFRDFSSLFVYSFGARLGKTIAVNLDSVLLARVLGPESVVMYSITATAPRQAENMVNLPMTALRAPLSHLHGSDDLARIRRIVERVLYGTVWFGGWIAAGLLALNQSFVELWVGGSRFAGGSVSALMAFLCLLRIWAGVTGMMGFSLGEIKRNSAVEWIYSLLLIVLVTAGISAWGILGATLAHLCAHLLTTTWHFPRTLWNALSLTANDARNTARELLPVAAAGAVAYFTTSRPHSSTEFAASLAALSATYATSLLLLSPRLRSTLSARRSAS